MTWDRNRWRREVRRSRGIGPDAPTDPALDVASLLRAGGLASPAALAAHFGMSGMKMKKAIDNGLTIWTADRYANALGFHPQEVWGEAWWEAGERYEALDAMSEAG